MNTLLLLGFMWGQVVSQGTGVITGIVRSGNGTPAPGVRVFAMPAQDAIEGARVPAAIEGLAQTDESGRYRLEVRPGRYYIASGAVGSPTYHPGTADVAAAHIVNVTPSTPAESVDLSIGVLSGTIRFADGTPAVGVTVSGVPLSIVSMGEAAAAFLVGAGPRAGSVLPGVTTFHRLEFLLPPNAGGPGGGAISQSVRLNQVILQTNTDVQGRYSLASVPPETYYVVAGYADLPVFYPGATAAADARPLTVGPAAQLSALDFRIPVLVTRTTVRGRVKTSTGLPPSGTAVSLRSRNLLPLTVSTFGLPVRNDARAPKVTRVDTEGRYEFTDVLPGGYIAEVELPGHPAVRKTLVVQNEAIRDFDFEIPYALLSGRVLWEDGTTFWSPEIFGALMLSTLDGVSTTLPIPPSGAIARSVEPGEYRLSLQTVPDEYVISSITAGGADLLKGTIKITGRQALAVEVRVARKPDQ